MRKTLVCVTLLCLSAIPWTGAQAQYQPAPTQYTIVVLVGGQTHTIYRDGDKALVDLVIPKSEDQPEALHWRTIVDVPSTTNVTWDLNKPSVPCDAVGKGDWGNPFDLWNQMALDDSVAPKQEGQETVNGMPTTTYEKTAPEGSAKFWRDNKYGLLVKEAMAAKGQPFGALFEIEEFKVGAPPASTFAVPKRCGWKKPG
jgi:hypothetical protein